MERLDFPTQLKNLKVAHGTHEGMVGKNNEDSWGFFAWQNGQHPLYVSVVADGVGGQTAGETASLMTVEIIENYFTTLPKVEENEILKHIDEAIREANHQVYERALVEDALKGMATTIVIAAVYEGRLYTSHVGDSRIYLWRDKEMHQLTLDHSWVQEAVTAGLLTAQQAKQHPNRNIIRRSLGGMADVEVDQRPISTESFQASQGLALQAGDVVLLCSDGLTDMIGEEDIEDTLERHEQDLDAAVGELIDRANDAGGRDNITVVLMQQTAQTAVVKPQPAPAAAPTNSVSKAAAAVPPHTPRVVPVALDKQYREEQARKRRILYVAILALVILVVFLGIYLRFFSGAG